MPWKYIANRRDTCLGLAAAAGLRDCLVGADWGTVESAPGQTVAFGRFVNGRILMNEQLVAAALLRLFPTGIPDAEPKPLAPPADFIADLAAQAPDATLLFIDGPALDHAALEAAGAVRWFTHSGQAVLRKDQIAAPMAERLREGEHLAKLSDTWPTPEALDHLYMNYCALTGLLPRLKRTLDWWKELLKRPDIRLQAIDLPSYGEEDLESPTGPAETS
ncbi:MAG TPA: hypothetical protein VL860_08390, partial [Planctomycetota bacterium]|nr:hypothetical protein [Planctomycetota bacterium]